MSTSYTDWLGGLTLANAGAGQDWTNLSNVGATNDNARASLPSSSTWSSGTSKIAFPTGGFIDFAEIIPEGYEADEIEIRIYTQAGGIQGGSPPRAWNVAPATSAAIIGTPIAQNLSSSAGWKVFGGALSVWGLAPETVADWLAEAGAAVYMTNGNSATGTIGLDAIAMRVGYSEIPEPAAGPSRPSLRVGVGI